MPLKIDLHAKSGAVWNNLFNEFPLYPIIVGINEKYDSTIEISFPDEESLNCLNFANSIT